MPLREQALDATVTGCRAGIDPLGDLGIAEPAVGLQQTQDLQVRPVQFTARDRFFQKKLHFRDE
jgi:hypothetical protein